MAAEHRFGIGQYAVGPGHFRQAMRGWCEMDAFTPPARPAAWQSRRSVAPALPLRHGRYSLWTFRPRLKRSEEHTSELQSLMRISYAVFCLKKNKTNTTCHHPYRV